MDQHEMELIPLFDEIEKYAGIWPSEEVLDNTIKLGSMLKPQLKEFSDGKFRSDRNETLGFFEAIEKFRETNLPIDLDFFRSLVKKYRKRIMPYPHYSGIKLKVPSDLSNMDSFN